MYAKEYKIQRIIKLLLQIYYYSFFLLIFYLIISCSKIYDFPELTNISRIMIFISTIIPITSGNWWFITTYFVLFLFIPVLNSFINKLNSRTLLFITGIILIFWVTPKIIGFDYSGLQMAVFYYILGAFLKKSDFSINKWCSLLGYCLVWAILTILDIQKSQIIADGIVHLLLLKAVLSGVIVAVFSPLAVLLLFEFFKNVKIESNKIINTVASTTFGIYLIHDSTVGRHFIWYKLFHCFDMQYQSRFFPLMALGTILIVFISCSLIDLLRQIIFEKKVLAFINSKLDNLLIRFH